ncbi:SUMF1/EgtB/PvdO family nonheme iron enzyme [Agromyces kandeliae]|uniref:SUMF1/EgtB/PvdO family nonheme iron enzyme n=1 Tax=Agromyces kandeliae TaxID=2666141 RepID=UPI002D21D5F1|nr:SUMF1/EgtB/PvdO family nonheme iron enzyme [Agromyces kandeliae]
MCHDRRRGGVAGAPDWRGPGGAGSSLDGIGDHLVVHVRWNDAQASCLGGCRLPSEAEREYASRDGSQGEKYP